MSRVRGIAVVLAFGLVLLPSLGVLSVAWRISHPYRDGGRS